MSGSLYPLIYATDGGITLGDFQFQSFEVPESVKFGGKNHITTHLMSGSNRTYDVMATEENDIQWNGILGITSDAESRCIQLQTMRQQLQPLPLTFGQFNYKVLIKEVSFEKRFGRINYSITCVVTDNYTQANNDDDDTLDDVNSDLNDADGIDIDSGPDDFEDFGGIVSDALAPVISAAQGLASLTVGSSVALGLLTATQAAQATIQGVEDVASTVMTGLGDAPVLAGGVAAAAFLNSLGTIANQVSQINMAANYVGRVVNNLIP